MISQPVIIFDVDGTLVESWTTNLLPGRYRKLTQLRKAEKTLYLATNQAGPAYHILEGFRGGKKAGNYPTLIAKIEMLENIRAQIGACCCYVALHPGDLTVMVTLDTWIEISRNEVFSYCDDRIRACWRHSWRKPASGMLEAIINDMHISKNQCLYVGDNDIDSRAAAKAGISYAQAEEFFNTNEPTRYP